MRACSRSRHFWIFPVEVLGKGIPIVLPATDQGRAVALGQAVEVRHVKAVGLHGLDYGRGCDEGQINASAPALETIFCATTTMSWSNGGSPPVSIASPIKSARSLPARGRGVPTPGHLQPEVSQSGRAGLTHMAQRPRDGDKLCPGR